MSIDIATWKLIRDSVPLAQILTFVKGLDQTKTKTKALDGTLYIQTIGAPQNQADVSIFVSLAEKDTVNQAEADGAFVTVVYRDVQYFGYVDEAPSWDPTVPGEWYTGTFKLLIEREEVL